jgi:malate synthase
MGVTSSPRSDRVRQIPRGHSQSATAASDSSERSRSTSSPSTHTALTSAASQANARARAFAKVREDKERGRRRLRRGPAAHPDLVPVCREVFATLGDRPDQVDRLRDDVTVTATDLLDLTSTSVNREGLHDNVEVALLYLEAWLRGLGAVGIHNLMEDAATAEDDAPGSRFAEARAIFEQVALADDFVDFLTLPAYEAVVQ